MRSERHCVRRQYAFRLTIGNLAARPCSCCYRLHPRVALFLLSVCSNCLILSCLAWVLVFLHMGVAIAVSTSITPGFTNVSSSPLVDVAASALVPLRCLDLTSSPVCSYILVALSCMSSPMCCDALSLLSSCYFTSRVCSSIARSNAYSLGASGCWCRSSLNNRSNLFSNSNPSRARLCSSSF